MEVSIWKVSSAGEAGSVILHGCFNGIVPQSHVAMQLACQMQWAFRKMLMSIFDMMELTRDR